MKDPTGRSYEVRGDTPEAAIEAAKAAARAAGRAVGPVLHVEASVDAGTWEVVLTDIGKIGAWARPVADRHLA